MLKISSTSEIIVTLGINPTDQIRVMVTFNMNKNENIEDSKSKKVKTFTEKPSQSLALQFIDPGRFFYGLRACSYLT